MRIVAPVSVHECPVFRAKIPDYQGALNLVQYTVTAADPRVCKTNVGVQISAQDRWQVSHDAASFHPTMVKDGQFHFDEF